MQTVLIAATDEALTTREDVKEILELTDSVHDEFLTRAIGRVSRRISTYLQRPLALAKYQAVLPAYGGVNLQLPVYPVRDVLRVFDGTDTGTATALSATEYRLDAARGWLNRDAGWPWTRQVEDRSASPVDVVVPDGEYKNYLVEFTAGYVLAPGLSTGSALWSTAGGSTATGQTLPEDIEEAALELTRMAYLQRKRDPGVVSERLGNVAVTYETGGPSGAVGIPATVAAWLTPYRSV